MIGCDRQQRSRYRADALWLVLGWPARLDSRNSLPLLIRPERSVIWIGLLRERVWLRVSYQLRGLYLLGSRESSERLDSVIQTESVAEVDEPGYCVSVVLSFFAVCPSHPNTYTTDILVSALPILPPREVTGHLGS